MSEPVSPELAAHVLKRDQGCVAAQLGAETPCHDRWGKEVTPWLVGHHPDRWRDVFTLDHVPNPVRATSKIHLATLCWGHHLGSGERRGFQWATANRPALREYLRRAEARS